MLKFLSNKIVEMRNKFNLKISKKMAYKLWAKGTLTWIVIGSENVNKSGISHFLLLGTEQTNQSAVCWYRKK